MLTKIQIRNGSSPRPGLSCDAFHHSLISPRRGDFPLKLLPVTQANRIGHTEFSTQLRAHHL